MLLQEVSELTGPETKSLIWQNPRKKLDCMLWCAPCLRPVGRQAASHYAQSCGQQPGSCASAGDPFKPPIQLCAAPEVLYLQLAQVIGSPVQGQTTAAKLRQSWQGLAGAPEYEGRTGALVGPHAQRACPLVCACRLCAQASCRGRVPVCVRMPVHVRVEVGVRRCVALARHGVHHHAAREAGDQSVLLSRPDALRSAHLQADLPLTQA